MCHSDDGGKPNEEVKLIAAKLMEDIVTRRLFRSDNYGGLWWLTSSGTLACLKSD